MALKIFFYFNKMYIILHNGSKYHSIKLNSFVHLQSLADEREKKIKMFQFVPVTICHFYSLVLGVTPGIFETLQGSPWSNLI